MVICLPAIPGNGVMALTRNNIPFMTLFFCFYLFVTRFVFSVSLSTTHITGGSNFVYFFLMCIYLLRIITAGSLSLTGTQQPKENDILKELFKDSHKYNRTEHTFVQQNTHV